MPTKMQKLAKEPKVDADFKLTKGPQDDSMPVPTPKEGYGVGRKGK